MTTLRKAAQQALAWIHYHRRAYAIDEPIEERNLRAALAQQEDIAQNLQSRLNAALLLEERRQEVAQPHRETEQEPTVRIKCTVVDNQHPSGVPFEQWVNAPRREWRGLTMQDINALPEVGGRMWNMGVADAVLRAIRAVERALKEKNA